MIIKKYLIHNWILCTSLLFLTLLLYLFVFKTISATDFIYLNIIVVCCFIIHTLSLALLLKLNKKRPKQKPLNYLIIKAIRIFLLLAFAVIICFIVKENLKIILIFFAICYLIWLLFDTLFYYKNNAQIMG